MEILQLGNTDYSASRIALGCMRMNSKSISDAAQIITVCVENGIDFFDHADIYGRGECETIFSKALALTSIRREDIKIQSKAGIVPNPGYFDFSKEHIIKSAEDSLKRLDCDYLDSFLLHRPDTLFEPEEVAEAFDYLEKSGKVLHFGVSNQNPGQIELLKKYVKQPLIINQLQFGVMFSGMIDAGFNVNMKNSASVVHDNGILEYSRLHDMTIQAWSPYQYGFFEGVFLDNDKFPELNMVIDELAKQHNTTNTGIATAWISRHPAKIQTIIGTMNIERITEIAKSDTITLTHEEWYRIYKAAGNILP